MKIKEMYKNENANEYKFWQKHEYRFEYNDPIEYVDLYLNKIRALFDHDWDFTPEECKKMLNACVDEYINHIIKKTGNKDINQNGVTPNRELIIDELEAEITD